MQIFGSLPPDISGLEYAPFSAGKLTGVHIAALKCLLAFGLKNNFKTKEVSLSLQQLSDLTGLSKPMVIRGIRRLIELGIVLKLQQDKTNIVNKYKLVFVDMRFTKIPYVHLVDRLANFPNKGVYVLTALKIYLILLQVRENNSKHVKISYSRLASYGINPKHISKALEILITNDLISISREVDEHGSFVKSCNNYLIKNLILKQTKTT
ncbi:hypothetical protein [Acinetobacter baumannii]|uniref:Uncharacterized protein n=1 Tax=Acinetobacter baumannii TaxID=470 RepID=A0AAP1QXM8_ACIBA|nr:hypothetical protein [Acinetobacter baumannii]MBD2850180.1 hypothetical protein [Acinetobacter baumannii]MBD2852103.1 hypothetical protein [Acinetobacter baumannii]MBD3134649.1 hypothetical protein [Acinetobacter baumannii]MBE0307452.1 hypothetical protein [Acinetobacter baumannii]MBE0309147.1 hypothetical protein [Acinetobacter baumannii]